MIKIQALALAALVAATPVFAQGARDAARTDNFARLNGTSTPAASSQLETGTALRALAEISRAFDYGGNGDADYWMKCTRDYVKSGRGLGSAMVTLSRAMKPGPLAASISGVGAGLYGLDGAGNGDANYWMMRTKEVSQRIRAAGDQLDGIAGSLQGTPAGTETVSVSAALQSLTEVAYSLDYSGRGDAEYWMRTTRNFAFIGRATGRALAMVASGAPAPLNGVLNAMTGQLTNINEAGNGNSDYWMARAQGVAQLVKSSGQSLASIAASLP